MAKSRLSRSRKIVRYIVFVIVFLAAFFVLNQAARDMVRSSIAYWRLSDNVGVPILHRLDAETAHDLTINILHNNYAPLDAEPDSEVLHTKVWGIDFPNPLGVAAGLDKQANAIDGLISVGFGFVEVGGVTPKPQSGNDKPRLFRLPEDSAVINRYGLNSEGHEPVVARIETYKSKAIGIVGINLAKNTTSDDIVGEYKQGVRAFGESVDFIVLNVSCPNVAWTKDLNKDNDELATMVCAVKDERDKLAHTTPLLLKLGPDMTEATKVHMAHIAKECGVDGLIVSNTTSARSPSLKSASSAEKGGLSGRPVKEAALQSLRDMYRITGGSIPIIGVGGIESGEDAYERIRAGASLVQIYTAMVYRGPGIVPEIKRDLARLLKRDGFSSVADAVGIDTR